MNRRTFNTAMIALGSAPLFPLPVAANRAAVPPSSYAWAQLIARAQNKCDPAMLARHLRIPPEAAEQLFDKLLQDGILQAPGITGVASAAKPINATGTTPSSFAKFKAMIPADEQNDGASPLVKDDPTSLGCDNTQPKDDQDASPNEPLQESPERG